MIIKSLKLTNFRNQPSFELICEAETSLIIGPNGFGKTSILEAIYIATRGKSFRATDPAILKHDSDFYRVELHYTSGETTIVTYDGTKKTFLTGDQKSHRLPKKFKYPIVLFEPSDLNLIKNSPSSRRTYFDRLFSELDPNYSANLSRYEKALKQRNELLKSESVRPGDLFSWNLLLAKHGLALASARAKFTESLNSSLTSVYRSIAQNSDEISLNYLSELSQIPPQISPQTPSSTSLSPSRLISESAYLSLLEKNFPKDHLLGHTTFGPHRDDYLFKFNSSPADTSASRGESRTMILALKFLEADLIRKTTNLNPLILLDDVFSELDESRRLSLVQNFKNNQIILTSVEKIKFP